jgi:two-component system sensor histidine kinase KdpD
LPSAAITTEPSEGDDRRAAIPLHRAGTLLVPRDTPAPVLAILEERIAPTLETLMVAALDREALVREVVESAALRRSDELKTAILRAVSHDLRSPLTAMVAAGEALGSPALPDDDRRELAAAIASEGARLTRLIEKLLDLSRLEAGTAEPRRDWTSIEEVIRAAVEAVGAGPGRISLVLDNDLPLIDADAAQLERAFANLLENALRHSDGFPVSVRARVSGGRLLVRIVDRGPGIPLAEQARIFEPFYRAPGARDTGSGLGLAIVKGFIEGNGGRVHVESLPEQGTSFVVSLPLPPHGAGAKGPPGARHPVPEDATA